MKLSKIFSVVMIAVMLIAMVSNVAFALNPASIKGNTTGTSSIQRMGSQVIGIIQTVGSIAAVAVLVVLGVKYMMGSAEEKAEYKKTMIPYVIGAVLIFAASNVAGFIYNWASTIS